MSRQKPVLVLIVTLTFFVACGQTFAQKVNDAASGSHVSSAPFAPQESQNYVVRLANQRVVRVIGITRGRLVSRAIGNPSDPLTVSGGEEFAIVTGPENQRITAESFRVTSIQQADAELKIVLRHQATGLRAEVKYRLDKDDFYLRKTISIRNDGTSPVQLLSIDVEHLQFRSAQALGVGKPVYAEGKLFLGLEFPLGHNEQDHGLVTLRHFPGKTLRLGESLVSQTAVVGTASDNETVGGAFDRYVRRIALRKPEVMTVYGNWARYDYISDTVPPNEKMVLETVDELAKMREAGWRPDYYVMDAGWFDPKGDYTSYAKPAWLNGPESMVKAINSIDMKYGLWFDVGGGIPDNPAVQPSKKPDGRMCLAPGPYIAAYKKALINQIEHLGLTMIKFDFATFDCNSDQHGHLTGEYASEASLTSFLDMIDAVRKEHPQVRYIIFNGFHRSPWWLMHVDTIYSNDPAPWDIPSLRLRDSINLKTDKSVHEHRFDHLLPWYTIDDCGLMIGRTGTIYWIGAEEFRKTWVLNIGRGGMMPFIYGDLRLLNDSDRKFIAKMWKVLRDNPEIFADTRLLGKANGAEIYGYSHFKQQHGFVFLSNPTFEQKAFSLKLDASLGLSAPAGSLLSVSELFPAECTYAVAGKAGFESGDDVRFELAPFEVRALEIKPFDRAAVSVVPPRPGRFRSISIPVRLTPREPEWLTDAMLDKARKEQDHLVKSTTAKMENSKELTSPGLKGIYSFSVELPKFDKTWTLAMPLRFMAEHKPVRNTHPTACAILAAWSGDSQLLLDVTPEFGRTIWSGCSWLTFYARLDPSLSGRKIEVMALNTGLEGAALEMDHAYLFEDSMQDVSENK